MNLLPPMEHLRSKYAGFADPIAINQFREAVSQMARNYGSGDRFMWQRGQGGGEPDSRRDLRDDCGWPAAPDPSLYDDLYNYDTIAARVVALPAWQSWKLDPWVYETDDEDETPFEVSFDNMVAALRGEANWYRPKQEQGGNPFFAVLRRADILSRRGRYGCVWLGFNDDEDPRTPVQGLVEKNSLALEVDRSDKKKPQLVKKFTPEQEKAATNRGYSIARNEELQAKVKAGQDTGRKLLFMRPYPEAQAQITRWEVNRNSPRYCMPLEYSITTLDPFAGSWGSSMPTTTQLVHWSRVIPIADTYHHATSSDVLATPAMQVPLYDILDGRKISGIGSEGYYRNAMLKLFFETIPQLGADVVVDDEGLRDMMERMENGPDRHGRLTGMHANPVAPTAVDPTPFLDAKYKRIAVHMGKPKRIFEGSERGELSSDQDEKQDAGEVKGRQERYVNESIIAPTINRLIMVGIVAEPGPEGFCIEWPDVHIADEMQQSTVFMNRMGGFQAAGASALDLLGDRGVLEEAGFSKEEAEALIAEAEERRAEEEALMAEEAAAQQEAMKQGIEDGTVPDPTDPEVIKAQQPQNGPPQFGGKPGDGPPKPGGGKPPFGGGKPGGGFGGKPKFGGGGFGK